MKILKSTALAAAMIAGALGLGTTGTSAAPVSGPASGIELPQTVKQFDVEKVKHRRYQRPRHGGRFRARRGRYRHYHGGYWYAYPWWLTPVMGRCEHWDRTCRRQYGHGRTYRRCMRRHDC